MKMGWSMPSRNRANRFQASALKKIRWPPVWMSRKQRWRGWLAYLRRLRRAERIDRCFGGPLGVKAGELHPGTHSERGGVARICAVPQLAEGLDHKGPGGL